MEALCNGFTEDDILDDLRLIYKSKTPNNLVLIDAKTKNKMSNTDIMIRINDLHKSLDNNHEVGIKIDRSGKEVVFYIDHIAHQNQSMIYFKGHTENGRLIHFVKPPSELKIALKPLQRRTTDAPKSPFGFADWDDYEQAKLQHN